MHQHRKEPSTVQIDHLRKPEQYSMSLNHSDTEHAVKSGRTMLQKQWCQQVEQSFDVEFTIDMQSMVRIRNQ